MYGQVRWSRRNSCTRVPGGAEAAVAALTEAERFKRPIVTELVDAKPFWRAEEYHQRYFEKRGIEPTCHIR